MSHRASLLVFLLGLAAGCNSSPAPTSPRDARPSGSAGAGSAAGAAAGAGLSEVARAALASREARRLAASLADDVGPRLAGSPGDAAAVAWAERTMKDLRLANVHLEPVVVPVWRRGEERARITTGTEPGRTLDVGALGWSGSTTAEGLEAEVVRVAKLDDLGKLPDDALRGKIVFVDVPMERSADGSGYRDAVGARYRAQTVGAAKGAVAALIRSVGTDQRYPHTGSTNRGETPGIPIGALSNASADQLARELAAVPSRPTRVRLVLISQRLPDQRSANVVGEIVGREKPDEVVLLGAHLDSWDLGRGALDDGSGCGAVLDAMRLLASAKPGRTIRVVLFAAEENSLSGGKQYAVAHASEADRIVFSIEVDGGSDRVKALGLIGDPSKADVLRTITEPLAPLGVRFMEKKGHTGADVAPLVARGVPSLDLAQDVSRYFDLHHTAGDTTDKLDGEALAQVTAVIAHVALRVADPSVSFGRVPSSVRGGD